MKPLIQPQKMPPGRLLLSLAFPAAVVVACFAAVAGVSPWLYLPLLPVITAAQMHLTILMHDGLHGTFFRRRWMNDLVTCLIAYPVGQPVWSARGPHLTHHAFVGDDRDPYLALYTERGKETRRRFVAYLVGAFVGARFFSFLLPRQEAPSTATASGQKHLVDLGLLAVTQLGLLAGAFALGKPWLYVLYLLPLLTVVAGFNMTRNFVEHAILPRDGSPERTVHMDAPWLERLYFSPCHFNYHAAHHYAPGLPYTALPGLHARLREDPAKYPFETRSSYVSFVRDYYRRLPA